MPVSLLQPARRDGRRFLNPVPTEIGGLRLMAKVLPKYLTNREETEPRRLLGPFRTNPAMYAKAPECGLRVTWFGHSSSLVEIDGVRLLLDPVWDERAAPTRWLGPKRFFPPTLPPDELPRIDAVLVSHDHYDHLGEDTVRALARLPLFAGTRWVTSLKVGSILQRFGISASQITELDWTDTVEIRSPDGRAVRVTALPARHFSGRSLFNRFETLWSSFVLAGPEHRVYFGADSGWWPGFPEIGKSYGPFDLTMLEIGAFHPLWESIHLGPDHAARAFRELAGLSDAGLLMPIHWGLFNLALHSWRQPIERLELIALKDGISLWSPTPGQPTEVEGVLVDRAWRA